jgi:hypothetical protein
VILLALLATSCASIPAGSPDAARLEPLRQLHERRGRLGWDGLVLGMTYREVEAAVGKTLPPAQEPEKLLGCEKPALRVEVLGTPLDLELSGTTLESRLVAIYAVLASPDRPLDPEAFRRAVRSRLDDLEFVPSRHQPGVSEEASRKALYQAPGSVQVFVDPDRGVYFGDVCVD